MPPSSSPANEAYGQLPNDATNPSRRRPRLDSETNLLPGASSQSVKPASKRVKSGAEHDMATKVKGGAPEIVDLTTAPAYRPFMSGKKLVIKNKRTAAQDERIEKYYAKTWDELRSALQSIFAGEKPTVPLERLYRGVEDICRHGKEKQLYDTLKEKCDVHLKTTVLQSITSSGSGDNIDMLKRVLSHWKVWNSQAVGWRALPSRRHVADSF
jgi:cullin 4